MRSPELKKNLVIILFISAIVLILLNVAVNKYFPPIPPEEPLIEITATDADTRFRQAIMNYGFEEGWIASKKETDPSIYSYRVEVPPDIPIALLVKEIRNSFKNEEAEILVEEKKVNGINSLSIVSNGHIKLKSEFFYSKDISRKSKHAGTLILNSEELSPDEMNALLRIPEHYGVVLTPSKNSALLARKVSESGKEVIVLLNDEIGELEFKLGPDFSKGRVKDVMRTIVGNYPKAVFYLLDESSSLFESTIKEQITGELLKRNIKLISSSAVHYYDENTDKSFGTTIEQMHSKKLIAFSAELYLKLTEEVERVRKVGFKFINPSLAVSQSADSL